MKKIAMVLGSIIIVLSFIVFGFYYVYQGEPTSAPSMDSLSSYYSDELVIESFEKLKILLDDENFIEKHKLNKFVENVDINEKSLANSTGYVLIDEADFNTEQFQTLSDVSQKRKEDVMVLRFGNKGHTSHYIKNLLVNLAIPTVIYHYTMNHLQYEFWFCLDVHNEWQFVYLDTWYQDLPSTEEEVKMIEDIFTNERIVVLNAEGNDITKQFRKKFKDDYKEKDYGRIQKELEINEYAVVYK